MEKYSVEIKDGYLGAVAWEGNNSRKGLWGSDLSKAIRQELKANGVKGVSVSCKHLDSLWLSFKLSDADFVSFDEYFAKYDARDLGNWIYVDGELKQNKYWWEQNGARQQEILEENAKYSYDRMKNGECQFSAWAVDSYKMLSEEFRNKVKKVKQIVDSYNYDDSNAMVDYFDRGFYDFYCMKYKASA